MHITDQVCPKSLVIDENEHGEDGSLFSKGMDSFILQVLAGLGIVCQLSVVTLVTCTHS